MNKIIVADIFGRTSALLALCSAIKAGIIVDPYDGKMMGFDNEAHAYHYFTENVGFDDYVEKLSKIMNECTDESTLIGFSVGAAAIWKLSESTSTKIRKLVKSAICYYGSQIRHLTKLSPIFDVNLVFPKSEPHFDVQALNRLLANKPKVTTLQVDYFHGFMNYHSDNFNQAGYAEHVALLQHA